MEEMTDVSGGLWSLTREDTTFECPTHAATAVQHPTVSRCTYSMDVESQLFVFYQRRELVPTLYCRSNRSHIEKRFGSNVSEGS